MNRVQAAAHRDARGSYRAAVIETADNAHAAHPEWSRRRCLREAIRIVQNLNTIIEGSFATKH